MSESGENSQPIHQREASSSQERLKIALLLGQLGIGGTELQVCSLAEGLRSRGHEVEVLVLGSGGPLSARLDKAQISWTAIGYGDLRLRSDTGRLSLRHFLCEARKTWTLVQHLKRIQPDVCHAFLSMTYRVGIPAAVIARVPVRIGARRRMGSYASTSRVGRWLEHISGWLSTALVANSIAVAADVIEHEGVRPSKVRVIPNGVDLLERSCVVAQQPPRAIVVANLIAYKGHADLLDALSLLDSPPAVDFLGDGPERPNLERRVTELGLSGVCSFEGKVFDVPLRLRQAQFTIHPSHTEGMPNGVIEAMAAGLPTVATRVGAIPELIADGKSGLLVEAHSPEQLAEAISYMANDSALRVKMGANAREIAERLSWNTCVDAHLGLYSELCFRRRRGRSMFGVAHRLRGLHRIPLPAILP